MTFEVSQGFQLPELGEVPQGSAVRFRVMQPMGDSFLLVRMIRPGAVSEILVLQTKNFKILKDFEDNSIPLKDADFSARLLQVQAKYGCHRCNEQA